MFGIIFTRKPTIFGQLLNFCIIYVSVFCISCLRYFWSELNQQDWHSWLNILRYNYLFQFCMKWFEWAMIRFVLCAGALIDLLFWAKYKHIFVNVIFKEFLSNGSIISKDECLHKDTWGEEASSVYGFQGIEKCASS